MTEIELIKKIKKLKDIKPRKDWVLLTKNQILGSPAQISEKFLAGKESKFELFPFFKPVYAGLFLFVILFSLLEFSQTALPSEPLYYLKRVVERTQAIFVSEEEKPKVQLEQVNKRLEELTRIAETNQVKKLAPAINEFQASVSEAAKNLSRMEATSSDPAAIKGIVDGIGDKVQKINASLGADVGGEEFDELKQGSAKLYIEYLISDLSTRTLTEEKEEILNKMKELVEEEKYSEALDLLNIMLK